MKKWNFASFTSVNMSGQRVRRNFVILMLCTAVIFMIAGGFAVLQAKVTTHTTDGNPLTSHVSNQTLISLLGGNIPYLNESVQTPSRDSLISRLALELMMSIDIKDPRTFLGHELPSFALFDTEIYLASEDVTFDSIPIDTPPDAKIEDQIAKAIEKAVQSGELPDDPKKLVGAGPGTKKVFIYHSHFSESFLPEIGSTNPNSASHMSKNITMVGKRLQQELAKMNIGSIASNKPYPYTTAYAMSKQTVIAAMKQEKELEYFIDIHRDSQRRDHTTKTYNGKTYARFAFVVGKASKNYAQNLKLAEYLHKEMNRLYPGLSRGVFQKPKTRGTNGEYNQSLSPNSMLVEVGGIDNNFEETYRAVDVLAKVLGERIVDATPAKGTVPSTKEKK
ncbi:stage II sporulation protein P [Thermoactinomyces sp. DSM 45891]|uniref:stage II sporulation protein P n=1 Tax=Thermoactinomyces sp. DSM 45891 TaxID=1761907 RepID=UPI000916E187|nr:stage II sporulation protein P [Thermoactinomyces sp. DSM 45891]SFX66169.1 stage II sporulation protein P [Thermoactinomyces sp. DSM 45891]